MHNYKKTQCTVGTKIAKRESWTVTLGGPFWLLPLNEIISNLLSMRDRVHGRDLLYNTL